MVDSGVNGSDMIWIDPSKFELGFVFEVLVPNADTGPIGSVSYEKKTYLGPL